MEITRVFLDIDMRMSFDGLKNIVKEAKTKTSPGSFIVFLNRKATYFKLLVGDDYIVSHRSAGSISLDVIQHFPQFFDGKSLDLSAAVEKSLRKKLKLEIQ